MKKRKITQHYHLIAAVLLLGFYISLWFFTDLKSYFSLKALQEHRLFLENWANEHSRKSVFLFISLYTLHGSFALPATSLLIMTGGFLFGMTRGLLYSLLASCIGGSIAFFATRSLFGRALHQKYHTHLASFKKSFDKNSTIYLLTMRFIPIVPFFLANILSGLALVPTRTFAWTLIIGILPSLFIYTLLGTELKTAASPEDLFSYKMISLYCIIALLSFLPFLLKNRNKNQP